MAEGGDSENSRELDVVLFGATGFTGKEVAAYLSISRNREPIKFSWALAGRSKDRLKQVREYVHKLHPDNGSTPIIVADCKSEEQLRAMCRRTRFVLNCVGPYRFFGEAVVKACVQEGTHYLDVTGEPEFIECMQYKYGEEAEKKGLYIVMAAGFDSVPADVGSMHAASCLPKDVVCTQLEEFMTLSFGPSGYCGHFATMESAIHGIGAKHELQSLRKKRALKMKPVDGPRLVKRDGIFFDTETVKRWCNIFPGADAAVVRLSQIYLSKSGAHTPFQHAAYFSVPSLYSMLLFLFYGLIFTILTKFKLGRTLLLTFPSLFSRGMFTHEGPSPEQRRECKIEFLFRAKGIPRNEVGAGRLRKPTSTALVRITGPEVYTSTAICLVESMLALLHEAVDTKTTRLVCKGGVVTPAVALHGTHIVERLKNAGLKIEKVEK
eukprot:CAMPEP_0113898904 /NCGR_PEP_ID=MMETSP0780_2-20120614/19688_1 /TAXON_ID=652834 /ORGANISM="Palpitomonas bilix" /LENGTH=435 /DNA_ID=CAMNT_0000890919 /DNA_START=74 /DNA_END=1381 /DNA_ORIENTATION=+ /assembly_acc=CAM_ASM_000599